MALLSIPVHPLSCCSFECLPKLVPRFHCSLLCAFSSDILQQEACTVLGFEPDKEVDVVNCIPLAYFQSYQPRKVRMTARSFSALA